MNYKKSLIQIFLLLVFSVLAISCQKNLPREKSAEVDTSSNKEESVIISPPLPKKEDAKSTLMSQSPVNPYNIDDFLFREDCIYIDLRSSSAFYKEGHIAGFTNIPFYDYLAGFPGNKEALFQMKKQTGGYLGDSGSFIANYEESADVISDLFPKNKNIIAISTAGVESCYFLNLLIQLGYDGEKLYNAGSFTNGMGKDIAYRTYKDARFLVKGIELVDTKIQYSFTGLSKR